MIVLVGVWFAVGDAVALCVAVGTVTLQGSTPTGKPVRRRLRLTNLTSFISTSSSRSKSAQRHCGAAAKLWPTQLPAIAKSTALTIPSLLRSGSRGSTTPDAMPPSLRISPWAERLAAAARTPPPMASAPRQTSSGPRRCFLGNRINPLSPPALALLESYGRRAAAHETVIGVPTVAAPYEEATVALDVRTTNTASSALCEPSLMITPQRRR